MHACACFSCKSASSDRIVKLGARRLGTTMAGSGHTQSDRRHYCQARTFHPMLSHPLLAYQGVGLELELAGPCSTGRGVPGSEAGMLSVYRLYPRHRLSDSGQVGRLTPSRRVCFMVGMNLGRSTPYSISGGVACRCPRSGVTKQTEGSGIPNHPAAWTLKMIRKGTCEEEPRTSP